MDLGRGIASRDKPITKTFPTPRWRTSRAVRPEPAVGGGRRKKRILFWRNKATDLIENKGLVWRAPENKPTVCGRYLLSLPPRNAGVPRAEALRWPLLLRNKATKLLK